MKAICCILLLLFLTGCWDASELNKKAFVLALALDVTENKKIELVAHVYKPASEKGAASSPKGPAYLNIKAQGQSIYEAMDNLMSKTGRAIQWSHMSSIMIGEKVARQHLKENLDFFYRNHEPRLTTNLFIVKGKAKDYLEIEPYIENTLGQQFREMEKITAKYSSSSIDIDLRKFAIQTRRPVGDTMIPYFKLNDKKKEIIPISSSLFHKWKMIGFVPFKQIKSIQMLDNKFHYGSIELSCGDQNKEKEAFRVANLKTRLSLKMIGSTPLVNISTAIEGGTSELRCSSGISKSEEQELIKKIQKTVKGNLQEALNLLQNKQADVLGIGNLLYADDPKLWETIKKDWPKYFARAKFNIQVDVTINHSGKFLEKPIFQEE
jgi:spore germination protein KC